MKTADMSVELVQCCGDDLTVVNAARVSFAKESKFEEHECTCGEGFKSCLLFGSKCPDPFQLTERDQKLISYLANHNHWTPFGHVFFSFRIKAPIFVARQLAKHQVGLVWNEVSRRYVDGEPEFYVPDELRARAENVKQGSSSETVSNQSWLMAVLKTSMVEASKAYDHLLSAGVCPEQARMVLPQNMMTEWWWSGSLAAFSRVYKLRTDSHAQAETQEVARMIGSFIGTVAPHSWKALTQGHSS